VRQDDRLAAIASWIDATGIDSTWADSIESKRHAAAACASLNGDRRGFSP